MHFTNRFYRGATIVIASLFALIGLHSQAVADELATETQPDWWQQDASLSDVFFIDAQHGWAVGSHGALLRTVDGGATWQQGNVGATRRSTGGSSGASLADKIQRTNQRGWVDRPTQSKTRKQFSCHFESVWWIRSSGIESFPRCRGVDQRRRPDMERTAPPDCSATQDSRFPQQS